MSNPPEVDAGTEVTNEELLRRQVEATLRFMATVTVLGLVVIAILAVALGGARGVLVLVGVVYLVTSLAAYWFLRRSLNARLRRGVPPA